jgi:hypothetical protein
MSKILVNPGGSPVPVADTGVTVPASSSYTIPAQDYPLWAASSDVVTLVGAGTLIVNDGATNLSISDGIDLVKGLFPIKIAAGNVGLSQFMTFLGDRLKVDAQFTVQPNVSNGRYYVIGAKNGGSADLRVNGSGTPVVFTVPADATYDLGIIEFRLHAIAGGVKFGQFLNKASALTNGILVEAKFNNVVLTFDPLKITEDFKSKFSFGPGMGFVWNVVPGRDDIVASGMFPAAMPLRKVGTFSPDDYIKVTVRDDLTTNPAIAALEFSVMAVAL